MLSQKNYIRKNGTVVVASPADKLGKDFDYAKYDKDGKKIEMLDKTKTYVDLDKATQVRDTLSTYVDDMTKAATNEIVGRIVLSGLLLLGSLCGIIAGLRGLLKTKGFVPAAIAAVAGLGALIGGIITKFIESIIPIRMPSIYGFNGILLVLALQLFPLVFLY